MEDNKKSASPKKNFAYSLPDSIVCIKGWCVPACGFSPQPTPRLIALVSAVSKLRFRLRLSLACCPPYAISDGGFAALRQFEKFDKFDKFDKFVT